MVRLLIPWYLYRLLLAEQAHTSVDLLNVFKPCSPRMCTEQTYLFSSNPPIFCKSCGYPWILLSLLLVSYNYHNIYYVYTTSSISSNSTVCNCHTYMIVHQSLVQCANKSKSRIIGILFQSVMYFLVVLFIWVESHPLVTFVFTILLVSQKPVVDVYVMLANPRFA